MDKITEYLMSQKKSVWERRMRIAQEVCFIFFSGFCTIADATTTALGVSSNLAYEINPMVAWRVSNPPLFIAFEAMWFIITVGSFQTLNYMRRKYNVCKPLLWNGYIIIILACTMRLISGLRNANIIVHALKELT
jgi:hypothetical protein